MIILNTKLFEFRPSIHKIVKSEIIAYIKNCRCVDIIHHGRRVGLAQQITTYNDFCTGKILLNEFNIKIYDSIMYGNGLNFKTWFGSNHEEIGAGRKLIRMVLISSIDEKNSSPRYVY